MPLSLGSNAGPVLPGCVTLARNFTPLSLGFFICKMGIMAFPPKAAYAQFKAQHERPVSEAGASS